MIIGITGSIGSGKTTVAKLFSKHWYNRIDADEIGHEIIKKGSTAYKKIIKIFGNGILDKNRNIDRKRLGNIVFNDNKKLKNLNSITHPMIIKNIKNQIKKIKQKCGDKAKIVIDAPLLLETNTKNLVDKIIVVKCNKENIIKRLNKTHKNQRNASELVANSLTTTRFFGPRKFKKFSREFPKEKIEKILKLQMPLDKKLKYADFVIDNNKDLRHLEKQVKNIIKNLNQ